MMTSAVRTTDFRRGFTLIEIVMVLAIAAMISGGAVAMMIYSSDERALRDISGEVEVFAKRARTISILQQTPYALEFRPGKIRLLPLAEAGGDDRQVFTETDLGGNSHDPVNPDRRLPVRDELLIPENMELSLLRWNSQNWIPIGKRAVERNGPQIWRFDPDGLCEPISLRYSLENGWAEDTYHPLTATIRDSQLEAR